MADDAAVLVGDEREAVSRITISEVVDKVGDLSGWPAKAAFCTRTVARSAPVPERAAPAHCPR